MLFDVGNVLVSFDHRRAAENLEKFLPQDKRGSESVEAIHRFLHDDPHEHSRNKRMDIGELSVSQLTNEFRREFGARCDVGEFTQAWCSIFDVNQHAIDCLNRVQTLGVRVGIASNTNAPHWDFLCRNFPAFQDPGIRTFLSFEIKHQKHAGEFFHRVLEETTRPPEEHLLLDDLEVNLRSAATVGMKTQKVAHLADFDPIDRFLRDQFWL